MPVIGIRISKATAARLLGIEKDKLESWEKNGVEIFRRCNDKRIYYLEDVTNFLMKKGLPTRQAYCIMSVSGLTPRRRKGGGAGK